MNLVVCSKVWLCAHCVHGCVCFRFEVIFACPQRYFAGSNALVFVPFSLVDCCLWWWRPTSANGDRGRCVRQGEGRAECTWDPLVRRLDMQRHHQRRVGACQGKAWASLHWAGRADPLHQRHEGAGIHPNPVYPNKCTLILFDITSVCLSKVLCKFRVVFSMNCVS